MPDLATITRVAADLLDDLGSCGIGVESVSISPYGSDIRIQTDSPLSRQAVAATLGLGRAGELYGETPLRKHSGVVTHDLGEFRVEVYGPAFARTAAAS